MNKILRTHAGIILFFIFNLLFLACSRRLMPISESRSESYKNYIKTYKDLAREHQQKYKIPASITLAQALIESGAGKSALAIKSNNHFGIKCHDWKGESVIAKDDKPDDCFRKYRQVADSYEDHSLFITQKPRYKKLFDISTTNYKAWAKGLQTAGYATDKAYANKLIKIIEDYKLYQYDTRLSTGDKKTISNNTVGSTTYTNFASKKHTPYITHNLLYVIAQQGDSFASIAKEFQLRTKDLCKFNEIPEDFPLNAGDIVYFQKKKKKADQPYYEHVVKVGESMYSISQLYGVRVGSLYKINKLDGEYVPVEGDVLKLR